LDVIFRKNGHQLKDENSEKQLLLIFEAEYVKCPLESEKDIF